MTTEQTAGTPPLDDGDAAEKPTTGTLEGDDRDAGSGEPDYKTLYLAGKDKIEEANRLRAENEALRARADQPPADQDDDEDQADPAPRVDWKVVEDYARRGDEVAKAQLFNRDNQAQLARDVRDSFHLRDIEDKTERQEVLNHYSKNRHRLADLKAAKAEVRERKLDSENSELRARLLAAEKRPPSDVPRTHAREVTSSEAKARKMTYAEFDQEQSELRSNGLHGEAMKRQGQLARGEIDIP